MSRPKLSVRIRSRSGRSRVSSWPRVKSSGTATIAVLSCSVTGREFVSQARWFGGRPASTRAQASPRSITAAAASGSLARAGRGSRPAVRPPAAQPAAARPVRAAEPGLLDRPWSRPGGARPGVVLACSAARGLRHPRLGTAAVTVRTCITLVPRRYVATASTPSGVSLTTPGIACSIRGIRGCRPPVRHRSTPYLGGLGHRAGREICRCALQVGAVAIAVVLRTSRRPVTGLRRLGHRDRQRRAQVVGRIHPRRRLLHRQVRRSRQAGPPAGTRSGESRSGNPAGSPRGHLRSGTRSGSPRCGSPRPVRAGGPVRRCRCTAARCARSRRDPASCTAAVSLPPV